MRGFMRVACGAVALLAALAAAGCGGSGSSNGSSTAATTAKLAGPAIRIGIISPESDPTTGLTTPEPRAAAQARVDAIDAAGGIKGHPLQLIACNSKDDPNTAANCARQMVASRVAAVIGSVNATEAQIYPILQRAGIAAIGVPAETPAASTSPVAFCFDPGVAGDFLSPALLLAQQGAKKVSMLVPGGVPGTAPASAAFSLGVRVAGIQNGGIVTYTSGQSQFDAEVAKATANGVDGVFAFAPAQTIGPMLQTIRRQKPTLPVVTLAVNLTPDVISSLGSSANDIYAVGLGQPATADTPGMRLFDADMQRYAPQAARLDFAINAWAGVWTFERLAQHLKTIDAHSVLAAMRTLHDFDMGGIYPPVTTTHPFKGFPGMSCVANPTVVFQKLENGKLVAVDGKFVNPFPKPPGA